MRVLRAKLRDRGRLLALLPLAGWPALLGLCLVDSVRVLFPTASALVTGSLVTKLIAVVRASPGSRQFTDVLMPLAGMAVVLLLGQLSDAVWTPLRLLVSRRIDGRLRGALRNSAVVAGGIARLESSEVQEDITRAIDRGQWRDRTPGTGALELLWTPFRLGGGIVGGLVLARLSWVLPVVVVGGVLWIRTLIRRQWGYTVTVSDSCLDLYRQGEYWQDIAVKPGAAKDVRVFGLADWVVGRFADRWGAWVETDIAPRRPVLALQWRLAVLAVAIGVVAYGWPAWAAAHGEVTAGELTTLLLAAQGIFLIGSGDLGGAFDLQRGLIALQAWRRVLGVDPYGERTGTGRATGGHADSAGRATGGHADGAAATVGSAAGSTATNSAADEARWRESDSGDLQP